MRKSLLTIAAGLALLVGSGAQAQGYVGAAAGWTKVSADCSGTTRCDTTDTGGKLYGGFKFPNQFAAEAVYFDWGKATAEGSLIPDVEDFSTRKVALNGPSTLGTLDLRTTGVGVGMAYFMPFATNWTGVVRLGVAQNKGKLTGSLGGDSETVSTRSTQPYVGLGIGYNLNSNLTITGEADFSRVKYGVDGETQTDRLQLYTLGVRFAF